MRFAVVTAVRNGEQLVADTVRSIVTQEGLSDGRHQLDYLIQDGNSSDRTVQIATEASLSRAGIAVATDSGMYDALARGFRQVVGDVYFYLNAGDMLLPGAFDMVAAMFEQYEPYWLCGMNCYFAANGILIDARVPFAYRADWIKRGVYGRLLPYIQQESTFWSHEAMISIDLNELSSFRLAGDFYLWTQFAAVARPEIVQAALGGFRYHGHHLSGAREKYWTEAARVAEPLRLSDRVLASLEAPMWRMPNGVKSRLSSQVRRYRRHEQAWG